MRRRQAGKNLAGGFDSADNSELKGRIGLASAQSAVNHDGGSMVPAEEVDGDPRGARLRDSWLSVSRRTGLSPLLRRDPPGDRAHHS